MVEEINQAEEARRARKEKEGPEEEVSQDEMSNSERDARAERRNQLRGEATEDSSSSEEVFIISLFNISHINITLSTLS